VKKLANTQLGGNPKQSGTSSELPCHAVTILLRSSARKHF
jgi:hypothetical protein